MDKMLFTVGKEIFPVSADYDKPVIDYWNELLDRVYWWGGIALEKIRTCFIGIQEANLCYAMLNEDRNHLWDWPQEFERQGIIPADAIQFFAFGLRYLKTEICPTKATPVVAAAPGSIWRCSHDILIEAPGLVWEGFYHSPGPKLHTESAPFQKDIRFLAVKR